MKHSKGSLEVCYPYCLDTVKKNLFCIYVVLFLFSPQEDLQLVSVVFIFFVCFCLAAEPSVHLMMDQGRRATTLSIPHGPNSLPVLDVYLSILRERSFTLFCLVGSLHSVSL